MTSLHAHIVNVSGLKQALACGALLAVAGLQAQTLSSPIAPAPAGAKPGATAPGFDLPVGQGAGVHGANSPFPPLAARTDVVPWSVLTAVKTKTEKNRILPVFNLEQMALNQKTQRIQGFMMPLDPGEKQKHFLLSSVPLTCAFCLPGGPESMVEVKTKTPVKYSMEPVVVEGRFLVLNDDSYGLYYRITDATSVK
ncbi:MULTISPECIES: DUF3299 domain-containing protein [unclassified Polaromonas]|uniref:DUF3299 domain-containing protein n=1 Tax=unclassified Polaromonas TaxID=2638319 RepID=UPI000F099B99|nr:MULTISPECIES: DUF3299 domain-containing protein [unclassified Polaromonas]AYQ26678.1 DUF3299 domain-containing protein [Polaromonas sp. SP1]QGJ18478.1 DUF3299 domain-containing protein [Polaromonas sp. Pch-P]